MLYKLRFVCDRVGVSILLQAELLLVQQPTGWVAPKVSPDGRQYFSERHDTPHDMEGNLPFEALWCRWQATKRIR
jgi:hypothetical protein